MKKIFWISIFLGMAGILSPRLFAAEIAGPFTPQRKLQRGFLNIALSGIEFADRFADEKKSKQQMVPSWIRASVSGTFFMGIRVLTGAYELLTFPVPLPSQYKPILNPEFTWGHFPPEEENSDLKKSGR